MAAMVAMATPPKLACEKIFERKDIRTKDNKITRVTNIDNYFRSITSDHNPKLAKEIRELVNKDKSKATNIVEGYNEGKDYIILNIPNNGYIINVGLWWDDSGYIHMFIQSHSNAFK